MEAVFNTKDGTRYYVYRLNDMNYTFKVSQKVGDTNKNGKKIKNEWKESGLYFYSFPLAFKGAIYKALMLDDSVVLEFSLEDRTKIKSTIEKEYEKISRSISELVDDYLARTIVKGKD